MVLDLGAGRGGPAKSAAAEGIDTTVYSVNPRLENSRLRKDYDSDTADQLARSYPNVTQERADKANEAFNARLSNKFADELDHPDNTFDTVIDHVAVTTYAPSQFPEVYEASMRQVLRVLKPGGKAIIVAGNSSEPIGKRNPETNEPDFKERALQKLGVRYEIVRGPGPSGLPLGAILYKDEAPSADD